jgi:hypothetical protein
MTTKLVERCPGPCPHALQEAGNRHTGDCYACGASAVRVIKDLHARVADLTRRLENECFCNEELRLELAAERLGSDL